MSNFEHSYALIIGINNYKNGISPLKNAVSDATEIARILETQHHYNVTLLLDEAATIGQLRQVLETELPNQIQAGDRFLFYFAGHGIALNGEDGPEGYLVPQGARLGNVSTYFPMSEVNKALLQLPCRHFLGILDCCFAGAFRWSSTRKAIPVELVTLHKERFDRFIQDPAWQVVTSAACDQSAWDAFDLKDDRGEIGIHSPFACALIEGLEGKADAFPATESGKPAGDGVITASELYLYLRDRVEIATQTRAIRQTPGIHCLKKHDKGEYIFLTPGHALNLPPAPPLDVSKNPYRGLLPFEEKHSQLFFGRNALTQKLCEFVTSHSLTVVLGASGSGKSSLVKAGIIPKLRQCKNGNPWFILPPFRPGESPFKALNNTLGAVNLPAIATPSEATSSGLLPPAERLANWFKEHPQSHLLLVVDQFEELITLCRNDQERQQFLEGLAGAIATYPNQLHLVLTLRSDFEPQFRNTALEKDWQTARFVVPAMMRGELCEAIEKPIEARVMYFQPHDLVEQLIDEVANMPGALPLLSFGLSELYLKYLKRQEDAKNQGETIDRAITLTDYEELGGVVRSLTQRADREYEELVKQDPAYAQTICHVMLRMVAVGGELARRRVPMSELEYPEPENTRVKTVIQHLSDARLLTNGIDSDGQPYVEPAHDALVRGWQRLLEWKQQDLASLLLQRELTPTVNKWASNRKEKQSGGLLWDDDPRLPLVKQISEQRANWLNLQEFEFVRRSIQQKRNKRNRTISITTGVIASLSGLTIFALIQLQLSILREKVGRVENLLTTDPVGALMLAIEATGRSKLISQSLWNPVSSSVHGSLMDAVRIVREQTFFEKSEDAVYSVAFSPDGKNIVTGSSDKSVHFWNVTGSQIWQTPANGHTATVTTIAFSPNGQIIASGSEDQTICLWDLQGNLIKRLKTLGGIITALAFSPDSQTIASISGDGRLRLWDMQGRELFAVNVGYVWSVAFSPDGKLLATGHENNTVQLWNIQDKQISKSLVYKTGGAVHSVAFSPDGTMLASSGGNSNLAYLWDLKGNLLHQLKGHTLSVKAVTFSPDSKTIASSSEDGTIRLWERKGTPIGNPFSHNNSVLSIAFSPDGKILASGSSPSKGSVRLWDVQHTLEQTSLKVQGEDIHSIAFSPNGRIIAIGGFDWKTSEGFLSLGDLQKKRMATILRNNKLNDKPITAVAFSPDGTMFVGGTGNLLETSDLLLWDLQGHRLDNVEGLKGSITAIAFSHDGRSIVSSSLDGGVISLWDLQGNRIHLVKQFEHEQEIYSVSLSPNGQIIASGDTKGNIYLWNRQGKKIGHILQGHKELISVLAFSPDGNVIVSGSLDHTIRLWNLNGQPISQPFQHSGSIFSISFSSDGKLLVIGTGRTGHDYGWSNQYNAIWLWDLQGNRIGQPIQQQAPVKAVAFSPDGVGILAGSQDGTIFANVPKTSWLHVACERLRYHPVMKNPKTPEQRGAKDTCQKFVW